MDREMAVTVVEGDPGEFVLRFAERLYVEHRRKEGRMVGEFNGTRIEITDDLPDPDSWVKEWQRQRKEGQAVCVCGHTRYRHDSIDGACTIVTREMWGDLAHLGGYSDKRCKCTGFTESEAEPDLAPGRWSMTMAEAEAIADFLRRPGFALRHGTHDQLLIERLLGYLPLARCRTEVLWRPSGAPQVLLQCRKNEGHDGPHQWEANG